MRLTTTTALATGLAIGLATAVSAQTTTLRIQNHQAPESTSGRLIADFVENVHRMSDGDIQIEMFYSSAVVASAETFDAAADGIIDCDMTNGSYQTGKNPAFQFVADTMGGYDTPIEYQAWVNFGGGKELINELYNEYGMTFIGAHVGGQESLNSTTPLNGPEDLKDWKFRSPPGMETEIFAELGASPIVMDFTEIFTALETGIIDGADASGLANNVGMGLYDIVKHATYPGFHSMPSDHLACNKDVWDGLAEHHKRIIETAMQKLALQTALYFERANAQAAADLKSKGVTLHDWSTEDRAAFRAAAQKSWEGWAEKTPEARALVDSHKAYLAQLGLLAE